MTRWLAALLVLMLFGLGGWSRVTAQGETATPTSTPLPTLRPPGNCGLPFNPCGALPFDVPRPATVVLPSPTRIPTLPSPTPVPATVTPSRTPTPTFTWTPSVTPTGFVASLTPSATFDSFLDAFGPMAEQANNLAATLSWQPTKVIVYNGQQVGMLEISERFGANVGAPIQFFRAVQSSFSSLGLVGAALNFFLLSIALHLFVYVGAMIAKPLFQIARFVINLIGALKPF